MMEMALDDRTTRCEVELGPMLAMTPVVSLSGDGGAAYRSSIIWG